MRDAASDVSIRSEIGFEEDLMRRLVEGTLDIGLMYTPSHSPGLVVEHLFDETLVLVSSRRDTRLVLANGGCCFLPNRMAQPFIDDGRLFQVADGREFTHPSYMVFPREADSDALRLALHGLRELAVDVQTAVEG
jgi:DNA-binding transcriptional LysR family regulator